MYIENYLNPEPIRSLRYGEKSIGLVVKTPDELEKDNLAGVYIPRYMFGLSVAEGPYEKEISFKTDKIVNSKNNVLLPFLISYFIFPFTIKQATWSHD